jgi:hypothetical protein
MKSIIRVIMAVLLAFSVTAYAGGSSPGLYYGQVPTAAQWNSYFAAKLDYTPGSANTMGYWDGSGNYFNAAVSGDCTSIANAFTCRNIGGNVSVTGNIIATLGMLATSTYSGAYTDGTIVDYSTGNGRISVGVSDSLTFYNGGLANTVIGQIATSGFNSIGGYSQNSVRITSGTNPTIASGFGTSPSIVSAAGTATFKINVGTGGIASSGVVTMPAATTGWNCNVDPAAAPQAAAAMYSVATSTTQVTITNYTSSTGAALAWPASAIIAVSCVGF